MWENHKTQQKFFERSRSEDSKDCCIFQLIRLSGSVRIIFSKENVSLSPEENKEQTQEIPTKIKLLR